MRPDSKGCASTRPGSGPDPGLISRLLLRTSRTFALSIPLLPPPTRDEVGLAYLLFRVADTLEDATLWKEERRRRELLALDAFLATSATDGGRALAGAWAADPPCDHDGYLELLREFPAVMASLDALQPEARDLVTLHTRRTIEGMAGFLAEDPRTRPGLADVEQLRRYCYAVAGIVGEMLTELFVLGDGKLAGHADFLRERAAAFGEALQLVNILRDASTDASEGRRYLPEGIERSSILELAHRDLDTAVDYVLELERARAARGVQAFCGLPVLLAARTLDRVERDGPGAKLSREEVTDLVVRLDMALDQGEIGSLWTRR